MGTSILDAGMSMALGVNGDADVPPPEWLWASTMAPPAPGLAAVATRTRASARPPSSDRRFMRLLLEVRRRENLTGAMVLGSLPAIQNPARTAPGGNLLRRLRP